MPTLKPATLETFAAQLLQAGGAPHCGTAPRLSTNPLAIGVPLGDSPHVLDFSTSATAEGKVRVKKIAGQQCPDGWLIDNQGRPTCDPNTLYGSPPGAILPM